MESKASLVAPQPAQREAENRAEPKSADEVHLRLAHLFRVSLKEGRVHPLYHVIQQYRVKALR
jgi:hypothetical protein